MPGLPGTERAVRDMAAREQWAHRPRQARGGGREYSLTSLPVTTQAALRRAESLRVANAASTSSHYQAGAALARRLTIGEAVDGRVIQRARESGAATAAGLAGAAKARMAAKLDVLARLAAYAAIRSIGQCAALEEFCAAYNAGRIEVDPDVRQFAGVTLHPTTLRRWKKQLKTQGPAALAGDYGNRRGSGQLDTDEALRDFVIGLIAAKPHISAKLVCEALQARFADRALPAERSVARWLARWKQDHAEAYLATTNPDAWKNRHMAAFGSASEGITRACQLWMMDSTPADLQLVDGRYTLIGVIDVAWRGLRLHVVKTSNAEGVSQLTRRAILEWGVPEAIKMDNGSDYASQRFARLLTGLNIEPRFSAPFSPWEKPHIERAFRTFSHSLLELLPGYTGHNVAEAQAIRARDSFADRLFQKNAVVEIKLTAAELQEFCDRWCQDYYAHERHDGLQGQTPFERFAQLRDVVRRIGDVRALDLLLGEGHTRTVTKKGLRIERLNYIAPELATVIGQQVLVRMDEADIGRAVVYADGLFLCVAECPEVAGVSRREIAIEAKAKQAAAVQEAKAQMRAAKRKAQVGDIAREILDHKSRQHGALAALPAPNVVHLTPALEAASEAAEALDAAQARPLEPWQTPTTLDHLAELRDVRRAEQAQDETAEQRFRRALDLLMKPEAERNDFDRQYLRNHCNSPEFRGRWALFEDFGVSAFQLPDAYAALLPDGAAFDRLHRAQQGE
ncbi:Mu transposase C-terminal domain-containing protein [Pseudoxanthomonas jiangsuensis]|uniref:Mu transposase C-terminal domain-containing protein n=1 Tax=Pseudoxanthomonas jiangsuensis TaxID=619688 RepID=UPI001391BC85|nr:Mu transposase C-terminal domain-containing protein [Pseudoxanthomonas jiangsuensis]